MNVSSDIRTQAIEFARELAIEHRCLEQKPYDRLWDLATKLNVKKISSGACRSQGFLKRRPDGSYSIYYCADHPITRRRFTIAHELGHIVLEKFVPHISSQNNMVYRGYKRDTNLEKTVDRIASELLMPQHLVVSNLLARSETCHYTSIQNLRKKLGVSESALIFRLSEIQPLKSILIRYFFSDVPPRVSKGNSFTVSSSWKVVSNLNDLIPLDKLHVEYADFSKRGFGRHNVRVRSATQESKVCCTGWVRDFGINDGHEYWIVGWNV